jgi:F-type H+-transporting ATPase subunit b
MSVQGIQQPLFSMIPEIFLQLAATGGHGAPESASALSELAGQFHVNGKLIFVQMINFALVASILYYFAFKPVLKTMDARQKKIQSGLDYAEEMKVKLAEVEQERKETLKATQLEAQKILADTRQQAKEFMDRQTAEAVAKVESVMEKGREANELERQKMLGEVRQEISRLVVMISGRVLSKELSASEKQRINEGAAKELASSN